jgi:hypothetical protein
MSFGRYSSAPRLAFGSQLGTSSSLERVRAAVADRSLAVETILLRGVERLDTLAGAIYGDASYWWILAAASGIGWGLQVPPGTIIKVPQLEAVAVLLG